VFGIPGNSFDIEFVKIGQPGNSPDKEGGWDIGAVGYAYGIGKYEISRSMVQTANQLGGLGITLFDLTYYGGNDPRRPATQVSWNEAARFVNWLNTSKGFQPAYKFLIQPGETAYDRNANILLWSPSDAGYDSANPFRNTLAKYVLPSGDEWYKAAYYDPAAAMYWDYATASNSVPTKTAGGTSAGTAVWGLAVEAGPAFTNLAGGASAYGTVGQGGNAREITETAYTRVNNDPTLNRLLRGGDWLNGSDPLKAGFYHSRIPSEDVDGAQGFRVVVMSVPEPSGAVFWGGGVAALLLLKGARRRIR
jgi:formylglycine-generating enzyme required for sulfatase activity